uniref:cytochrome c oxidase subunit III n=1 Tax=Xestocephalus biprocessus TaxID=3112134 RepID=UPI002E79C261|nr:cytochrome c oxidase subunit III [Xestocephalus biprocessus]WRK21289.1 cytochrome c oxidase subunit III [Xestocephalus biprocessus]
MNNHPYHLVDKSPWPLTSSMGMLTMMTGTVMWFHKNNSILMNLGLMINLLTVMQWWRDVVRESTYQGLHTNKVVKSMNMGMILFISSEIMFFLSFFWTFFHSSLSPNMEIGMMWPPKAISTFNPMNIPLLNTTILLSSGMSMTWAHMSLMNMNMSKTNKSMLITVMLGIYFSILQAVEYQESKFTISDSIYGSTFFLSTGFHGIHVIIGTMFILVSKTRIKKLHMSSTHHVGFETSAWYWHFVDVVWLFLYLSIYWWGS